MVGSSYDQKPYRRSMMQTWGATVHRSPSSLTQSGSANAEHSTGSLGIAISEAVEVAAQDPESNYALGSVLNHVLLHQTIIGQETIAQMELAGEEPDVVIGCVGGGSNFAGLAFPWLRRKLRAGGVGPRFVAAEPAACPTLTQGVYAYDFGDTAGLTPLMPMYTLGHGFVPPPVHAGGLRYHGDAPMVCALLKAGMLEARAYRQNETFAAALQFARSEGIIPAPEPAHAIRAAIEEAEAARDAGEERVILFGLCGHGHFDLAAYDAYLAGTLEDPEFSREDRDAALAALPAGAPSLACGATSVGARPGRARANVPRERSRVPRADGAQPEPAASADAREQHRRRSRRPGRRERHANPGANVFTDSTNTPRPARTHRARQTPARTWSQTARTRQGQAPDATLRGAVTARRAPASRSPRPTARKLPFSLIDAVQSTAAPRARGTGTGTPLTPRAASRAAPRPSAGTPACPSEPRGRSA